MWNPGIDLSTELREFSRGSYYYAFATAILGTGAITWYNRKSLLTYIINRIASGRKTNRGEEYLVANFAPVHDESLEENLQVVGSIPKEVEGAYIRNGPNPLLNPAGGYHWFDGDGMIHGVRIKDGNANYANHFVRTNRLKQEQEAGQPLFMKMGDCRGKRGLLVMALSGLQKKLGLVSSKEGTGTANTALVYHAQKILSLHEGDLPYVLRVLCSGVIETVERLRIGGQGSQSPEKPAFPGPFTAHPKVDPETGEMFFFGYSFDAKPYVRAGLMSKDGDLLRQWAVDVPYPVMMHDCACTRNYAVIMHMPLCLSIEHLVKEDGLPISFMPERSVLFGLLRKDAPSCKKSIDDPTAEAAPVQWFKLPSFFVFHVANAYEDEEGRVHIIASHYPYFSFQVDREERMARLTEYVLDPSTGTHSIRELTSVKGDFPVVNPEKQCHPFRYVWIGSYGPSSEGIVNFHGIAKHDLHVPKDEDACVAEIRYPEGCAGGEATFVPRYADPSKCTSEDDGFLMTYVHDSKTDKSSLHIYDAKTMDSKPLAQVLVSRRVPHGFHGMFVREEQLKQQK